MDVLKKYKTTESLCVTEIFHLNPPISYNVNKIIIEIIRPHIIINFPKNDTYTALNVACFYLNSHGSNSSDFLPSLLNLKVAHVPALNKNKIKNELIYYIKTIEKELLVYNTLVLTLKNKDIWHYVSHLFFYKLEKTDIDNKIFKNKSYFDELSKWK